MKPWFRAAAVIAVLAPVAGCSFYFGDDGDDTCPPGYAEGDYDPGPGYRNPDYGTCENWGGGPGCGDGDHDSGAAAAPDWASCASGCEGLDPATCSASPECRTIYVGTYCPPWADCPTPVNEYLDCWGIAPSGPATGEECWGLDAYSCSRHNDCSAVYTRVEAPGDESGGGFENGLSFVGCQPEVVQGCYSDEECPDGYECTADTECLPPPCDPDGTCDSPLPPVCYGTCVPSTNVCETIDCGPGYHCEELCYPCDSADGEACPPICQAQCVPDYDTCSAIDCGPGYECEEICYPCDPLPDGTGCEGGPYCEPVCVPITPPTCDAVDCGPGSHCELQCYPDPGDPTDPPTMDECYPVCVPDTGGSCDLIDCIPGYHCEETCSTGPCLPDGTCPPPTCSAECVPDGGGLSCESITSEDACTTRPDCVAVYTGDGCECYPWGCVCTELTFERCETGWVIDPDPLKSSPLPRVVARH